MMLCEMSLLGNSLLGRPANVFCTVNRFDLGDVNDVSPDL